MNRYLIIFLMSVSVALHGAQNKQASSYLGHDYVDMGIRDEEGCTVFFATCNLGAKVPEDFGEYYAWGETETKAQCAIDFSNYFDTEDNGTTFLAFNVTTGMNELDSLHDAASVQWGGTWRMPTMNELKQLKDSCLWTWTTIHDVNGYLVTATNGNSIFLPASGCLYGKSIINLNKKGTYWTHTLHSSLSLPLSLSRPLWDVFFLSVRCFSLLLTVPIIGHRPWN